MLPFENASGDSTLDYLAEGMSDEVRSQLTEIPGLSVRARSSSQAFRGRRVDLAEVGAKLGVSEVLQASVRAAAGRLHVTAELVRIADGTALWSHAFDGQAASLATVQDSITRAIAGALRLRLREGLADAPGVAGARIGCRHSAGAPRGPRCAQRAAVGAERRAAPLAHPRDGVRQRPFAARAAGSRRARWWLTTSGTFPPS